MCLRQTWMSGVISLFVLSGAAFADVTVSQSNDPTSLLAGEMTALLGAEKSKLKTVPKDKFALLASGPTTPLIGKVEKKTKVKKPQPVQDVHYDAAWLASLPAPKGDEQWQCLTEALYFEARGESLKGQFAVAEVILNRADSPKYPRSVCGVVNQAGGGSCQFSYVCDGRSDTMKDREARDRAARIARVMLDGAPRMLTDGATHFHTKAVRPGWAHRFPRTASIGAHLFYRQPGANG
jgi:spore germination cell wall hydrolase CwlJ-like protein